MARNRLFGIALCEIAAFTAVSCPGYARPLSNTLYEYYAVSGKNAATLHQSIIVRGPTVGGSKAYASTEMTNEQDGDLVQDASGCTVKNYKLRLTFVVQLPRLRSDAEMSPGLRRRWASFEKFVRKHEGVHRSIWMSCAASAESRVKALNAHSCEAVRALATGIISEMWMQCAKRHDAFDAAQRSPLMRQPFIAAAGAQPAKLTTDGSRVRATRADRVPPSAHPLSY